MRTAFRRTVCAVLILCLSLSFLPVMAEKADVKALQERLLALGYEIGAADGVAGKKTTAAVMLEYITNWL